MSANLANPHYTYQRDMELLMMWDKRMAAAAARIGLTYYPIDYKLTTDAQVTQVLPYVGMPNDYVHWSKGKEAEKNRNQGYGGHIYEMVLNTNPSIEYLSTTNTLPMQLHVMAHATYGHVVFFKNNKYFGETMPESIIARLAQARTKIDALVAHPDWGWEGYEYYMDALHALENHVGWLPTIKDQRTDRQLRDELKQELANLRRRVLSEGEVSQSLKVQLERQAAQIEQTLKRYPIQPQADLLGFLMDPENTPHLPDEARMLVSIVRDRSLYFQPQGRTKFMNEGFASRWQRELLLQPEVAIPLEYRFDLAQSWNMHYQVAVNNYFDPYAMGLNIWDYIDRTYGYDEKDADGNVIMDTVKAKELIKDADGNYVEGRKYITSQVVRRNRDKMFHVLENYDDNRFVTEFMNEELFEYLNLQTLDWVKRVIVMINKTLIKSGWNRKHVFNNPLPLSLEDMMAVIQTWSQVQETSEAYHEELGTPLFPVPAQTLQQMATVIQIVAAFDQNKHKARRMLAMRTAYHSVPNITVQDTGKYTDGVWTLKHEFDPNFGPLMQSEARTTLRYFRRLCGNAVRLLTMEPPVDSRGRPTGPPRPFEYFTEDGDIVKERWL
ncbi:MAG: SpoVR family protein [Candidatus Obscuribacter sp.]|jgi:spore cortex formation protein SpoVR/YcgB (stage V sporulation)|nr:SpoVR family protein [Candidatus Obscuribacter sp.]MBK9204428.1 SpoVR family protein [Candidatus Obscuribacter sp.]MBK9622227.1 SpoVR family protein [Candidatus Obscuribacter sp.]